MDSIMGMDSMGGTPPPTGTESASASGATHTIIVAPTKGVLRFGKSDLLVVAMFSDAMQYPSLRPPTLVIRFTSCGVLGR